MGKKDAILDAMPPKPNPLLVDIYGPAYQKMSSFKQLSYDNVPPPKPLNKAKRNTVASVMASLEATGFNDSVTLGDEMSSLLNKPQESLDDIVEKKKTKGQ